MASVSFSRNNRIPLWTSVKNVNTPGIFFRETRFDSRIQEPDSSLPGNHCVSSVTWKEFGSIQHDTRIIKGTQDLILIWSIFPELRLHVRVNVGPEDLKIIVSIRARVHVIESYCMHQFMNNDSMNQASVSKRYSLRSSHPPNHGVTAAAAMKEKRRQRYRDYSKRRGGCVVSWTQKTKDRKNQTRRKRESEEDN